MLSGETRTNPSLEIIMDKICCVEEWGIDWGGSDEIFTWIDIDDGKHPLTRVRVPQATPVAYQAYYSMDAGDAVEVNRSIYRVTDVGPYLQINVVALDDEWSEGLTSLVPAAPARNDEVIGSAQIRFTQVDDWERGRQHRLRCGGPNACVDLYFTIK